MRTASTLSREKEVAKDVSGVSVTQREGDYMCHEDNESQDCHYGRRESQRGNGKKPKRILWWQIGIGNISVNI